MLPTVGVEEELLLVDPATSLVTARAPQALRHHSAAEAPAGLPLVEEELYQQQLELATEPCADLAGLHAALLRARVAVLSAAEAVGALAVAVPAPVLDGPPEEVTPGSRYRRIHDEYGEMARQGLVCGMHVHVEVADDPTRIAVVDGLRPWLPVLLAVSANSPYWRGADSGHASWRSQIWSRWPTGGPREPFRSPEEYARTAERLQEWGAALDAGMLYYDVRPAREFPTVELRVSDVCTEPEDAVLVAALVRALVHTLAREHRAAGAGREDPWRTDLLRAAQWRAARFGMATTLVHPERLSLVPARDAVLAVLDRCAESLEESGDRAEVVDLLDRMLARGPGAARQRAVFAAEGTLEAVVADLARRTAGS